MVSETLLTRTYGRKGFAWGVRASLLSAAFAWPTMVAAQSATVILPPTREEVTREPVTQPPLLTPRLDVEGGIERAPCALDGPEFKDIRLMLREVQFDGLRGATASDLTDAYSQYVGTNQPISVVCEIRDRAATILRQAGYVAAVQVPEQRIADGVVRFQVLMAHLTQVRVRGEASGAERTIAGYLQKLTEEPVFNKYQAERYLLLASDIPGYSVRLTLRPAGTGPGEVIGDVTVQRMPLFIDSNIQNAGSDSLGPWGGLLGAQLFGLTGFGDRTTLSVFSTSDFKEQQTVQFGHDFRIGPEGLSISNLFTYAWARPSIEDDSKIRANTLLNTFEVAYPLIRKLTRTVRAAAGLDFVNQDVRLDGIDLTRDRLRVAYVRLAFDTLSDDFLRPYVSLAEPLWRLAGDFSIRKGLSIFGASDYCGPTGAKCLGPDDVPPSRLEGRPTAFVVRGNAYGEFRPIRNVTFGLNVRSQYAWKPLISFEEYAVGNYTVGRGYDPGTLIGDKGIGFQTEIRIGSLMQRSAKRPAIQGYAFWDWAKISNHDKLTILDQNNHLNSVGGGLRIGFGRFALETALAVPLTRVSLLYEKPDPRVLVALTTRLWPWSLK